MPTKKENKPSNLRYFYQDAGLTQLTYCMSSGEMIVFSPYIVVDPNRGRVTYMMTTAEIGTEKYEKLKRISGSIGLIETDNPLIFATEKSAVDETAEPRRIIQTKTSKDGGEDETKVRSIVEEPKSSIKESDIKDLLTDDE